jgi:hypothetical protein
MSVAAGLCSSCWSENPRCGCVDAVRILEPIRYQKLERDGAIYWHNPEPERIPPSQWAKPAQRQAPDAGQHPFRCAGCDAPLTVWARARGFVYCSAECRTSR